MEVVPFSEIIFSLALLGVCSLVIHVYNVLWLNPERLRSKLRGQGIKGPSPSVLVGNIPEMKKIQSTAVKAPTKEYKSHNIGSTIFPYFQQWMKEYGRIFTFALGNVQLLFVADPDVAKEISLCTSLELGKPAYQQKERGALLGQGILTSNGAKWTHHRKTIAPELYMEKVKGMMNIMVESASILVKSWDRKIETEGVGGVADIRADEDLRTFSSFIISKTLFGSSYSKGTDIFLRVKDLNDALSSPSLLTGVPGFRHIPTKNNRNIWRLEKEIESMILNIVNERTEATSDKDLLQMIIKGASNGPNAIDQFIVDNCKNIYLAGYETSAVAALWGLMLLASHPEWQARARDEVVQICGGRLPDADMLRKMKTLTMVVQEVLRLYPPVAFVSREALQDLKFGDIHVPKGVNVWVSLLQLHVDPAIWGADAHKFNPERFAQGILGACKLPQVYMPFGVGPRICAGQNFAMAEMKIVLALILSNFSFSLSPKYRHSPAIKSNIVPEHGLNLIVKRV